MILTKKSSKIEKSFDDNNQISKDDFKIQKNILLSTNSAIFIHVIFLL